MTIAPESLPDDIAALKHIIAEMARDAVAAQAEIAKLKFQLARYRRAAFGRSSEKLTREIEQLELAIESLESDQAERLAAASPAVAAAIEAAIEKQKPARRPLPEHLPREEMLHPAACACPHCGGALRRIGEDVTETLDYVPGRFKVIRHIREKLSCRTCDTVVAAPAPDHAIARGRAGAGLLAHIVVSKYDDHLPLYRQAEIFAREGVSLETSTLSGWVGATAAALKPLVDALAAEVIALGHTACRRHAGAGVGAGHRQDQDRAVVDLCPRRAAVRRLSTAGGAVLLLARPQERAPAGAFAGLPRRHPRRRLFRVQGAVRRQSDRRGRLLGACPPQILRRPCRQRLGDRQAGPRPDRRSLRGRKDDHRLAARPAASPNASSAPSRSPRRCASGRIPPCRQLSRKSELAKAFRYMRSRWKALLRCLDDGRLALDNNPAERALRCVAIGRKNYLFAGSDAGGRRAAAIYSLIETAKLNGRQPAEVSRRRAHPHRRSPSPPNRRFAALALETRRAGPRRRLNRRLHRALRITSNFNLIWNSFCHANVDTAATQKERDSRISITSVPGVCTRTLMCPPNRDVTNSAI